MEGFVLFTIERFGLAYHLLKRERRSFLMMRLRQPFSKLRVFDHEAHGSGESRSVLGRDQESVLIIGDDVGYTAYACCDHRQPGMTRFDDDVWKCL